MGNENNSKVYNAPGVKFCGKCGQPHKSAAIAAAGVASCECEKAILFPELSRTELEMELLKEQSALFLAAQETLGTTNFNAITTLIADWERRSVPYAQNAAAQKIKRHNAPKIKVVSH